MRNEPDPEGAERQVLVQYLEYQQQTVLQKAAGLDGAQLAHFHPPSALTIGGLLNHLALVEDNWIQHRFLGLPEAEPWSSVDWEIHPDWDFETAAAVEPDLLRDRYLQACRRTLHAAAEARDLGQLSAAPLPDGRHFSLRWVLLHLIEETARHAGHADLLREAVDGSTGE